MAVESVNAIELKGITKRFGPVAANDHVDLTVRHGEILSILGENGSGKTTLMNVLSGIYFPDEGQIFIDGREVVIRSPKDAFALGIGMIHQHFKLIDVLSAAENIVLGLPGKMNLNIREVAKDIQKLMDRYGFDIDLHQKIYEMSVSQKQTVEIVKMLYRGAKILILDEPTAVLTPQETDNLFDILRAMRDDGRAIVIITHKLNEVMSLSSRVSVLRKGRYIGTVDTKDTNERELTEMMVGEKVVLDIERPEPKFIEKRLSVNGVTCYNKEGHCTLDHAELEAFGGEILGIAGVAGSGQRELLEAIAGLQPTVSGNVDYFPPEGGDVDLTKLSAEKIDKLGVKLSFVPEDRLGMGLVASMDMTDNMLLRTYKRGGRFFADRKQPRSLAEKIIKNLKVSTPGVSTPISRLSGGNVQKVLVGREIASSPTVLMVAYPVRGLDINSSYTIYHLLNEQKQLGVAVVCVGEDLDVLLALCDRILVLCAGRVTGVVDARTATKEEIGLMMAGRKKEAAT